ncbi:CYFA0S33e00870g1_1 [Cyberlindnera fabianii]|uniref:CYFA0S33e00870g1_1 n=1 Tax=Cyberlindnera fabianii TaxID=36022 RepID=A0A061BE09_CYBFA|nr:CYFA0S33e00870g1_1 [Cyberlindnera fabianii]
MGISFPVDTVTSCIGNRCDDSIVETGVTFAGTETIYSAYCPLTTEAATSQTAVAQTAPTTTETGTTEVSCPGFEF